MQARTESTQKSYFENEGLPTEKNNFRFTIFFSWKKIADIKWLTAMVGSQLTASTRARIGRN